MSRVTSRARSGRGGAMLHSWPRKGIDPMKATPMLAALALMFSLAQTGCVSTAGTPIAHNNVNRKNVSSYRPYATSPSPAVITYSELSGVEATSLEQAIRRLRPEFLRERNQSSQLLVSATPDVYMDDRYYGELGSLGMIPLREVREVRLVSAVESTVRYGRSHAGGTIVVRTR